MGNLQQQVEMLLLMVNNLVTEIMVNNSLEEVKQVDISRVAINNNNLVAMVAINNMAVIINLVADITNPVAAIKAEEVAVVGDTTETITPMVVVGAMEEEEEETLAVMVIEVVPKIILSTVQFWEITKLQMMAC